MSSETSNKQNGSWSEEQHMNFIQGLLLYGKDWIKIVQCVPTRSGTQIRSHAQKFFNKLESQFESRAILGKESEYIMGPPTNEKQYQVYLSIVKSRRSSKSKVKPLQPGLIQNSQQNMDEIQNNNSHTLTFMTQQADSTNNLSSMSKNVTYQSLFAKMILKDRHLNQISSNFYTTYVDIQFPTLPAQNNFQKVNQEKLRTELSQQNQTQKLFPYTFQQQCNY